MDGMKVIAKVLILIAFARLSVNRIIRYSCEEL
ncbi:MAG: hypothetical protein C5S49_08290 [Candidatus Methanogaster sp.]|nr:MAG: hypothetical protein C5S49_08290 [ANME-2 cluster archaeon]